MTPAQRVTLDIDLDAFTADVRALEAELRQGDGAADLAHLRRVRRVVTGCWLVGWAFAWLPNPVSPLLIAFARSARWTSIAHHVLHRGYDRFEAARPSETSRGFAKGWRRFVDWPDWLVPDAWKREHNQLHHYRLGEVEDPDVVELNTAHLQSLPRPLRAVAALFLASIWKPTYYAPSNQRELRYQREGGKGARPRTDGVDLDQINPLAPLGREVWLQSWIPYVLWAFVALPALFLLISPQAALIALGTSLVAELLTNLHTFAIVVTNHAGGDIYRFEGRSSSRGDFYVRQITGSVNFRTGGDANDLLHGWLNYQVEHHIWPNLSPRQYQRAQPLVRAACARFGVPYTQESVWVRLQKTVAVMIGDADMSRSER